VTNFSISSILVPGSLLWRARNVALGSLLGAAICFPIGNRFVPQMLLLSLQFEKCCGCFVYLIDIEPEYNHSTVIYIIFKHKLLE
jgi:hypothetical protein